MQYRLHNELHALGRDADRPTFHLFSAEPAILPTHNAAVRRAFERVLAARGVVVHRDAEVVAVEAGALRTRSGETFAADEIVWVTQAGGAPWLGATGLALDPNGFVRVATRCRPRPTRGSSPPATVRRRPTARWKRPACSPCAWAGRWRDNLRRASSASRWSPTARSAAGWR